MALLPGHHVALLVVAVAVALLVVVHVALLLVLLLVLHRVRLLAAGVVLRRTLLLVLSRAQTLTQVVNQIRVARMHRHRAQATSIVRQSTSQRINYTSSRQTKVCNMALEKLLLKMETSSIRVQDVV